MAKRRQRRYPYGKFHHDTYEFRVALRGVFHGFFESHPDLDAKTGNDIRRLSSKVLALLNSWIGSKKLETKFGIKIPLHTTPPSIEAFLEKQSRSFHRTYKPCEICGEDRVTHYCHILPLSAGGPSDERNYVYLCPTHHHLFDHNRLSKEEWGKIDFSGKLQGSQEYAQQVKLPRLEYFWESNR